jgi:hypothetical protein
MASMTLTTAVPNPGPTEVHAGIAQLSAWCHVASQNLASTIADTAGLQSIATEVLSRELSSRAHDRDIERLVDDLRFALIELHDHLISQPDHRPVAETSEASTERFWKEGMLALDWLAAELLHGGKAGDTAAAELRKRSRERALDFHQLKLELAMGGASPDSKASPGSFNERCSNLFKLWSSSPPPVAKAIALVLWRDRVEPKLRSEREETLPALSFVVHEQVVRTMTSGARVQQGVLVDKRGTRITEMARPEDPLRLPALDLTRAEALIARGGERLGSLTSHRLIRWEVRTGHAQAMAGASDPRRIRVVGGWEQLASRVGAGAGHKVADDVRAIIHAQAHLCFSLGKKKRGNLLSYTFEDESRIRRAEVVMVLGDALLPHFVVTDLRSDNSRQMRENRRLVPVVDLPPFVGRPNEYGAQASFQARIVAEMRRRAAELFETGGVRFDFDELARIALNVELPSRLLQRVLDRWLHDGDDGPAFLEPRDRDRYTLAEAHAPARDFLIESGRNEVAGAKKGRKSVHARRQRYTKAGSTTCPSDSR